MTAVALMPVLDPSNPRYGIVAARQLLPLFPAPVSRRAVIAATLKQIRRADAPHLEERRDVAVLRRYLDLLNAADRLARLRAGAWRTVGISPAEATACAVASDAFGARAFALNLRSCSDAELFYHRLAHRGEIGRRGEVLRECVEAELLRRPWLAEVPEDASEFDPAVY